MIPQTHAGTRTPACPGGAGGGSARPARNRPCGPKPPDRDRGAWYVADIDRDIDGARGPEREKKQTSPSDPDAVGLGFQ